MPDINSGWIHDPKEIEKIMAETPEPYFFQAGNVLTSSGKGKSAFLYKSFKKLGIPYPKPLQSSVGDCFNGDALVTLYDGSVKPIKDISIGDRVITPFGNIKNVTNVFKKSYSGKMLKIDVQSYHKPLICTPDHKIIECTSKHTQDWTAASNLDIGKFILIPKLPNIEKIKKFDLSLLNIKYKHISNDHVIQKFSKKLINRFITNNEKLYWLLGIFLAEGSFDYKNEIPSRITFNLSSNEQHLAKKIQLYINDLFGVNATITSVPSKPTVLYVRLTSAIVASFFKEFCYGNVWNKSFNNEIKLESYSNKLALLTGWLDGDGWNNKIGVTVSKELAYSMFDIANSIGLNVAIRNRKAYKQSKKSYSVALNCDLKAKQVNTVTYAQNYVTKLGKASKIKSITVVDPIESFVYCIEVEDDHAFICDGYAVHNCVSHASAIAVDTLSVCEIAAGERETWEARAASEYIYSISRVIIGGNRFSGDGSVNAFAVKGMRDYGTLRRKKYNSIDLTIYNPTRARQWGSQKISTELIELAKPNNVTKFAAISNFEEACDALYNGYPIIVASSQGFASRRDTDGFAAPQGKWMHSMAIIGYKDDKRPGVLIQNSWPGYLAGPNPHDLPDSAFWCDADVFNRMCKFQDTFSIAGFNGFKLRANARVL